MGDDITRFPDNPKRVLHVVGGMDAGGIETFIMSIYRLIDKKKLQFDFLVPSDKDYFYNTEIQSMGGRIFVLPWSREHPLRSAVEHEKFYRSHPEYPIVHFHAGSIGLLTQLSLRAAVRADVCTSILHSHCSARVPHDIYDAVRCVLHVASRPSACKFATDFFACSADAARWFGFDKFSGSSSWKLVRNGVDTKRFVFDTAKRASARAELGFGEGEFVVGNVGRFSLQKNQIFLVDMLSELVKVRPESRLLLVGGFGSLEDDIRERCRSLGVWSRVTCLKGRADVDRLLCAMDAFVFPSLYEGLGIAFVEAQASGLSCYVSHTIPKEAFVVSNAVSLPIDQGINLWVEALASASVGTRNLDAVEEVKSAGYDIRSTTEWLQEFYLLRFSEGEK